MVDRGQRSTHGTRDVGRRALWLGVAVGALLAAGVGSAIGRTVRQDDGRRDTAARPPVVATTSTVPAPTTPATIAGRRERPLEAIVPPIPPVGWAAAPAGTSGLQGPLDAAALAQLVGDPTAAAPFAEAGFRGLTRTFVDPTDADRRLLLLVVEVSDDGLAAGLGRTMVGGLLAGPAGAHLASRAVPQLPDGVSITGALPAPAGGQELRIDSVHWRRGRRVLNATVFGTPERPPRPLEAFARAREVDRRV